MSTAQTSRTASYGEKRALSSVDRFGVWLSTKAVRRMLAGMKEPTIADIGCGYNAVISRSVLKRVRSVTLVDLSIDPELGRLDHVTRVVGHIPEVLGTLESNSYDGVLCISVLEHLWKPKEALGEIARILRPGGTCIINVPSWLGKHFLEFSAFRLGLSPSEEMDDHKRYYSSRELWMYLVEAGFLPHAIRVRHHKFGLNVVAVCRKTPGGVNGNDKI